MEQTVMPQVIPDEVFLLAFAKTIDRVCRRLSSHGVADDAIWAGFRKATTAMGSLSLEVEDEPSASRKAKDNQRNRRSLGALQRKSRASSKVGHPNRKR